MQIESAKQILFCSILFRSASFYEQKSWHTSTDFNELSKTKQTLFFGAGITAEMLLRKSKWVMKPAEGPDHLRSCSNKHQSRGHIRPCFPWEAGSEMDPKNFPLAVGFKPWMLIQSTQGKQSLVFNPDARKVCYWMTGMLGKPFSRFLPFIHGKVLTFS